MVYVDLSSVKSTKPEWGLTILNKLELGPREPLTVVGVNPANFEINQVFDACFPTFSASEIDDARKSRGFWDKLTTLDPNDQQKENLQTFDARLRNALDKILAEAAKFSEGGRKNILGAITLDKNRYTDRSAFYRVVIYTDGTLKEPVSDGSSAGSSTQNAQSLADRYPASFSGAEVDVFGVEGENQSQGTESKEQVFSTFFLKNWAYLKSFSPGLPQQSSLVYAPALRMDGSFEGGGTQGSLKLILFGASQESQADGWLAFNVGRDLLYVPMQGDYRCNAGDCRLTATATMSVPPQSPNPYFRKGDRINLSGVVERSLQGILQSDAREVFREGNQAVKYDLKFSKQ